MGQDKKMFFGIVLLAAFGGMLHLAGKWNGYTLKFLLRITEKS